MTNTANTRICHRIYRGMLVLVVACLAMAPLAVAAAPKATPSTRVEVVVDGLQSSPTQTFEALSFDGGIANSAGSGGGGSGRATLEDIVIAKAIDGVSPRLLDAAVSGRHLSVTVRVFQRSQQNSSESLVLEVTAPDAAVSLGHESVSTDASASGSSERVTFRSATATFAYPAVGLTVTVGPN